MIDYDSHLSDIARSGPPLFFPDASNAITFNFDQGIPAPETFPLDELLELHGEILERDSGAALEYISMGYDSATGQIKYLPTYVELVLGNEHLRAELAKWLSGDQQGPSLAADNFILCSGSVQAIALAMNALVDSGDGVIVESATFPYAVRYAEMRGAEIRTVALDADGLVTDDLERVIDRMKGEGVRPKVLYTVPTFQLPTGVCTSMERRSRLLELADEHDFLIIEDDIYGRLRYSGSPIPSLLELDRSGRVLQSNGFSKTVAPALRLGWIAAPAPLIAGMAAVRQDLGVSQWTCRVMAEYVARGMLDRHIDQVNDVYRIKRDLAVDAVREHCTPWVSFDVPDGGFYLWLTLSDDVDWERAQLAAESSGIAMRPGERFARADEAASGSKHLRLAFSHVNEDELRRGIAALGQAIKSSVR